MGIKHAFTNPKSDGADATIVRPSDWNADHTYPSYETDDLAVFNRVVTPFELQRLFNSLAGM